MRRLHIAMISYHTCPLASVEGKETGGMNVYLLELSQELAQKNCVVDIYTRSQDTSNPEVVEVSENLRVIHLPAGPLESLSKKEVAGYLDEFTEHYTAFVAKEGISYDLLHCHYYLSGLVGLRIKEKHELPMVMTFHTLALMKNLVARSEQEKEESLRIHSEFLLAEKSDSIITPSESDAAYMQFLYDTDPKKLVVIPPGIDTVRFHPIEKQRAKEKILADHEQKVVLFVGRIEPLKGIDTLIYAMKIIVARNPSLPVRLMIVGGDVSQKVDLWAEELQRLEQLRNILHIPDIVTFVGQRSQDELPYYYNSAEVVVMPSHYESFGMAALEAMACGIPVITSNVSGVARIIDEKHASLITTVNNPLLLASQIESLLTNEGLHEQISEDITRNVADLTWSNTAEALIEVYDGLLVHS